MRRALFLVAALVLTALLGACAHLLGIRPSEPKPFAHHAHDTRGINCRVCHAGIITAEAGDAMHLPDDASCARSGCHEKPHDARPCSGCHEPAYVREGAAQTHQHLSFSHRKHLEATHGECVRCHAPVAQDSDHIRPPMALCLSCHEHSDQLANNQCDTCHRDLPGEHVAPSDHLAHEGDWLREHGTRAASARELCSTCHTEKQCLACHGVATVPMLPEKMFFDDPLRAGVHRAGFRSRHSLEAKSQPGLCLTCHSSQTCDGCHAREGIRAVAAAEQGHSPHPPGWVGLPGEPNDHGRAAWRDPSECASCHTGAGEALCVGCHKVGAIGGNPHRPGWTSNQRPNVDMPCRLCHGVGP
jgi:hypothetical protein